MDISKIQNPEVTMREPQGSRIQGLNQGPSFKDTLKQQIQLRQEQNSLPKTAQANILKFSQHAIERMQRRGIQYDQDMIQRIADAVNKAALKGSRDSLILTDDSALIVSVKNNTVVTVMDKSALKQNVFTNIDSTIMI